MFGNAVILGGSCRLMETTKRRVQGPEFIFLTSHSNFRNMLEIARIRNEKEQVIASLKKRRIDAEEPINRILALCSYG